VAFNVQKSSEAARKVLAPPLDVTRSSAPTGGNKQGASAVTGSKPAQRNLLTGSALLAIASNKRQQRCTKPVIGSVGAVDSKEGFENECSRVEPTVRHMEGCKVASQRPAEVLQSSCIEKTHVKSSAAGARDKISHAPNQRPAAAVRYLGQNSSMLSSKDCNSSQPSISGSQRRDKRQCTAKSKQPQLPQTSQWVLMEEDIF
jgi:hypothetical protein